MSNHSFDIDVACEYGLECAILIHHFQYWIAFNERNGAETRDGHRWMYQTQKEMSAHFPYLSKDRINDLLDLLTKGKTRKMNTQVMEPILMVGNYNKLSFDRTCWYAFIDEKTWLSKNFKPVTEISKMDGGDLQNRKRRSPPTIPDTKTHTKKDNVSETLSSSPAKESKPQTRSAAPPPKKPRSFVSSLTREQKALHDQLIKFKPVWGDPLKSDDVCAWFLSPEKKWSVDKLKTAFQVYKQDCLEAEKRKSTIRNMGGFIVEAYLKGRGLTNADSQANRAMAENKSQQHAFITLTKRYVKFVANSFVEEVEFNMPHLQFMDRFEKSLDMAKIYG